MIRRPRPAIRYLLLLFLGAACFYLFASALDMPVQELHANTLSTLRATVLLAVLSVFYYLFYIPDLRINATDLFAAALFAVVSASRFIQPGAAAVIRYDEILQASVLYLSLRIMFAAEKRTKTVLLVVLCFFGIFEAWIGIRQVYGLAYSNHGLFKITGTFFNPGPYAGFLAPVAVCAVVCILRLRRLAGRIFTSWGRLRRQRPGVLLWGAVPYLLSWGALLLSVLVLPASMSRAGLIAVAAGGVVLLLCESDYLKRFREACRAKPLRTGVITGIVLLLLGGAAAGAYYLKRPSADGRLLMWKVDTRILLRHPLCGAGLGNFAGAFGEEQADYFASKERPQAEKQVAGCPESGFNEFLQFGAETGFGGFALLLLLTGTAIASQIRQRSPFGYALLTATVFACFSYPWSVLPLRLLFVLLLAGTGARQVLRIRKWRQFLLLVVLFTACFVCWPRLFQRYAVRVEARRQWSDVRMWMNSGRYDYLVEDGRWFRDVLRWDFRFLYDYGYALHKTGDYRKSNEVLLSGAQISSDPIFWSIIGKNQEALGDLPAAEAAYLHAHYMIPDRVYPLYLLSKLYVAAGQLEKASATANEVTNRKPKIESVQTREMQQELREMLDTIRSPRKPE